jgi:hypothetical protein
MRVVNHRTPTSRVDRLRVAAELRGRPSHEMPRIRANEEDNPHSGPRSSAFVAARRPVNRPAAAQEGTSADVDRKEDETMPYMRMNCVCVQQSE